MRKLSGKGVFVLCELTPLWYWYLNRMQNMTRFTVICSALNHWWYTWMFNMNLQLGTSSLLQNFETSADVYLFAFETGVILWPAGSLVLTQMKFYFGLRLSTKYLSWKMHAWLSDRLFELSKKEMKFQMMWTQLTVMLVVVFGSTSWWCGVFSTSADQTKLVRRISFRRIIKSETKSSPSYHVVRKNSSV